jgi:hypothetical protein
MVSSDPRLQMGATQGARTIMSASTPTPTDVILVASGEPADQSPEQLGRIRDAVTDANVLLVAPALPVVGERWIVDRDARATQARSRLQHWIAALADQASAIATEVGDADPRIAASDARRARPTAQIIDALAAEPARRAAPGRLMRLVERYRLMPAPVAAAR